MNNLTHIALLAAGFGVFLGVLAIVARLMGIPLSELLSDDDKKGGRRDAGLDPTVYEQPPSLLSDAELNFYRLLVKVVANPGEAGDTPTAIVMSKVRACDLVRVRKGLGRSAWQSAFNRIKAKHVDFVLCDPESMRAICIIELDDASHTRGGRSKRDAMMDSIYEAAGLPILHVNCRRGYSMQEVGGMIRETVGRGG